MSSNKKELLRSIFTANRGCGCGRPKLSDIVNPTPRPRTSHFQKPKPCPSSSSSWERGDGDHTSTTTFSLNIETCSNPSEPENDPKCKKMISPSQKLSESIAVVKDSNDPYHDFRQSMLQMILEKQIFSKGDLQELLKCFLQLNSPCHHDVIIQAFMEIWNGVISERLSHQV
ncbi:Transcription repressor OFP6 [Vitis vinifera]|uniref:Transcription repressor n=1 Tax=Vitis vinifera TaxID=29760 RepID=A0A438HQI6_VITVI|nr:Transcription repressor OFP6 [Vitis vinifera]